MPGGLELLPNKRFKTSADSKHWLRVHGNGAHAHPLPKNDPYAEIYEVPAELKPSSDTSPSANKYWGLVDPGLLDPARRIEDRAPADKLGPHSQMSKNAAQMGSSPFHEFLEQLRVARTFHDEVSDEPAKKGATYVISGAGAHTADAVDIEAHDDWVDEFYGKGKFQANFTDASGEKRHAVMDRLSGDGDGTVPRLGARQPGCPEFMVSKVKHQKIFSLDQVYDATIEAIIEICYRRYREARSQLPPDITSSGGSGTKSAPGAAPAGGATARKPSSSDAGTGGTGHDDRLPGGSSSGGGESGGGGASEDY
jgi:uncharacterized membrane protein YgcG